MSVIPPGTTLWVAHDLALNSTTCHLERGASGVERSLMHEILLRQLTDQNDQAPNPHPPLNGIHPRERLITTE